MNRGPVQGRSDGPSWREKTIEAWGTPPAWIEDLANLVDAQGLSGAAKIVHYSSSTLSEVLRCRYRGDMDRVETHISSVLLDETVICPVLGEIGKQQCLGHQDAPRRVSNSQSLRLWRACRSGCPHSRLTATHGGRNVR